MEQVLLTNFLDGIEILKGEDPDGIKAMTYRAKFLEYGVVGGYKDKENKKFSVLLKKENMWLLANKFKGIPVINDHVDNLSKKNVDKLAIGYISSVEEIGGCFYANFLIHKGKEDLVKNKLSVSCSYLPTAVEKGGIYNGQKYRFEVTDGEPNHLGIVKNPRYNDCAILYNSINKKNELTMLKIFKKEKKNEVKLNNEEDTEKYFVKVEGEDGEITQIPFSNIMNSYKESEKVKKEDEATILSNDHTVSLEDGKEITVEELVKNHLEFSKLKNEMDKKKKKKKDMDMDNKEDDEDKDKDDDNMDNMDYDDMDKKKKKKKMKMNNSLLDNKADYIENFKDESATPVDCGVQAQDGFERGKNI